MFPGLWSVLFGEGGSEMQVVKGGIMHVIDALGGGSVYGVLLHIVNLCGAELFCSVYRAVTGVSGCDSFLCYE